MQTILHWVIASQCCVIAVKELKLSDLKGFKGTRPLLEGMKGAAPSPYSSRVHLHFLRVLNYKNGNLTEELGEETEEHLFPNLTVYIEPINAQL